MLDEGILLKYSYLYQYLKGSSQTLVGLHRYNVFLLITFTLHG
jgi:hypothetical protein